VELAAKLERTFFAVIRSKLVKVFLEVKLIERGAEVPMDHQIRI
jgi:hypothetical protein